MKFTIYGTNLRIAPATYSNLRCRTPDVITYFYPLIVTLVLLYVRLDFGIYFRSAEYFSLITTRDKGYKVPNLRPAEIVEIRINTMQSYKA